MGLFRKRKKVVIDERTELEKSFEDKGQQLGKDTGEFVQKSIDKINEIKEKYEADGKIEKVKDFAKKAEKKVDKFAEKAEQKVEKLVGKATVKGKEVIEKVKKK